MPSPSSKNLPRLLRHPIPHASIPIRPDRVHHARRQLAHKLGVSLRVPDSAPRILRLGVLCERRRAVEPPAAVRTLHPGGAGRGIVRGG